MLFCFSLLASLHAQTPPAPLSNTVLEQRRREALMNELNTRAVPFEERSLFSSGGFGSSIYVRFTPKTPEPAAAGTRLILAIPLAGTDRTEGAFSFGIEAGLAFIEAIRGQELLGIPVLVAFLGDERSRLPKEQGRPHLGLADLYTAIDNPEAAVLLYVDIETAPEQLLIHHGAAYTVAARNALEGLNTLCKSRRVPYTLAVRFNELYKLGLVDGPDLIAGAAEREINALYLEAGAGRRGSNRAAVDPQSLADLLAAYAGSLPAAMEDLDYHFLILNVLGGLALISETQTIVLFTLIAAILLFILLVYTIVRRKHWLLQCWTFIRRSWIPLFFVSIMLMCLEASGSFIMLASRFFAIDPRIEDYGRAGFKILLALFFFSLFSPLQHIFRIPRKAVFYGSSALLFVVLGMFIAIFFDIVLIPLLLSFLLVAGLGGFIKIPLAAYLCAFSLPVLCLNRFLNIRAVGSGKLAGLILSEEIQASLFCTIIMLPFIFLFERAEALSRLKQAPGPLHRRRTALRRFIRSACILAAGLLAFMVYMNGLSKVFLPEAERRSLFEEAAEDILSVQTSAQVFLERRTVHIAISARGEPVRFDLFLDSSDGTQPVLYESAAPFELNDQRNSLALLLGEGPPNPMALDIVVPLDFFGVLRVEALYTVWDSDVDPEPEPAAEDYLLKARIIVPVS